MINKFRQTVDEYIQMGHYDFWYLNREDRHKVIAAWLQDNYFGPNYKAFRAWELISEISISDELPRLIVDIAAGNLNENILFNKIIDAIEKDMGHKISVDYVETADVIAALNDSDWREARRLKINLKRDSHDATANFPLRLAVVGGN